MDGRSRWKAAPAALQPARTLWWLRPAPLVLVLLVPVYLSYLAFPFENWVPRRYVPSGDYVWGLVLLGVIALGAMLASAGATRRPAAPPLRLDIPAWYLAALLAAALLAYAIWFGPLLAHPDRVIALFSGERGNLRDTIDTEPGITTLTQCGVAYIVLYVVKQHVGSPPPSSAERAGLWLLFVLTLMRAVLWSERLAIIEAGCAYVITQFAFLRLRPGQRQALAQAPFVGPVVLYVAFTATEYFRSWTHYKQFYDSVWVFSFERLTTYYAVATNSGIGLLRESADWPRYTGRYVLEWLYRLPGLGDVLLDMAGDVRTGYRQFLEEHGRLEFNNPTGLFITVYDIGYVGSLLYFFAVGALVGLAWKAWFRHRLGGLLFYPFCFLFVLEVLRFNYLAASRLVPIAGSLLLACLFIGNAAARRRRRPAATTQRGGMPSDGSTVERYV